MWIAPRLTDGLCNRLFQIAAALGYAERWGYEPVFFIPRVQPSVHSDCTVVHQLFPKMRKVWSVPSFEVLQEKAEDFLRYEPFDAPSENTVIQGYFQCEKYFPKEGITLDLPPVAMDPDAWWLHIRLGDYLQLPHHQIPLKDYLYTALEQVPGNAKIYLLSDDLHLAQVLLANMEGLTQSFLPFDGDALETLSLMSRCGGGCIGTNSTFSWWGMYLSEAKKRGNPCFLPKQWHRGVPDDRCEIHSPWITVI